jgi:poly(A) polymerase
VLPDANIERLNALVERNAPVDDLLRLAALLKQDIATFAKQWKLSGAEQEKLRALSIPNFLAPEADDAVLRRALVEDTAEALIGRSWLGQDDRPGWGTLRARLAMTDRPAFPLQGRDLTKLGVAAGPRIGEILKIVHDWWMQGGCIADAAACQDRAAAELVNPR